MKNFQYYEIDHAQLYGYDTCIICRFKLFKLQSR